MFNCSSSLDTVQTGSTALLVAAQEGHCEIVRMLLEAKADVNVQKNVSASCSIVMVFVHILSLIHCIDCVYCQCKD